MRSSVYRLTLGAVFLPLLLGCSHSDSPVSVSRETGSSVVFDSGLGNGPYDSMTYAKYESELEFTPTANITVRAIRPTIWYCNGSSGFLAFIRGEHYEFMASEAALVDGSGAMRPLFGDRKLETELTLEAGKKYRIVMEVWTTKSVGIWTTGSRTTGTIGSGNYTVSYAHSNTADHLDRGAIAFQLLE